METVVWPRPEEERTGTPLLVMMHGYGTDESRMVNLFDYLPPEFTCAALRAPMPIASGYGWFRLDYFLTNDFADVIGAANSVFSWIDSVKGGHSSVSLLGYSQGMAMASTLLRLRPRDFPAVVGLSGFVVDAGSDGEFRDAELDGTVPLFWGRDQQDPVITPDKIEYTMGWVRKHVKLTKVLYTGMWHSINAQEIGHVSEFLTHEVLNK